MERLQEHYLKKVAPQIQANFGLKNVMQVPKILKVVVNVGVGKFSKDSKAVDSVVSDITKLTGQKPVKTLARKSIAGFKVRENQVVGVMVTLRGNKMYSFIDKLINVALPRVRDFQGLTDKNFDGHGNFHLGLREHLVFPEISSDSLEHTFGLEVSVVTNAGDDKKARELLKLMGFPFKKEN